jgi:hypothetical protein
LKYPFSQIGDGTKSVKLPFGAYSMYQERSQLDKRSFAEWIEQKNNLEEDEIFDKAKFLGKEKKLSTGSVINQIQSNPNFLQNRKDSHKSFYPEPKLSRNHHKPVFPYHDLSGKQSEQLFTFNS